MYDFVKDPLRLFSEEERAAFGRDEPQRMPRPRTLAAEYLVQAVDAIRDSGSADTLYDEPTRRAASLSTEEAWTMLISRQAVERRIRYARTAMLFAAFSAEAYINEFLWQHVHGHSRDVMDRMATVDKYALGTRFVLQRELFDAGAEPIQTLRELFKQRDLLVHPKPGKGVPGAIRAAGHPLARRADDVYNPREAVGMIIAVAEAASVIVREGHLGDGMDAHAELVLAGREGLRLYGEIATSGLALPSDAPKTRHLLEDAADARRRAKL